MGGGAPVRLVHLGLGNFFRAHQAWYTDHAGDADGWGYAAFTGRSPDLAAALTAQGCRYTLITRAADGDSCERISALSAAHSAADHEAWLGYLRSPELAAVTITVTEAGYFRRPDGRLDVTRPEVAADLAALRADPANPVRTAPVRLIAGLRARRLDRIAADGSQKLPERMLPVLRAERAAGHLPPGASRVLAAWICHLRGLGAPVNDARAGELLPLAHGDIGAAVLGVLGWLDAGLAGDRDLAALVTEQSEQLSRSRPSASI